MRSAGFRRACGGSEADRRPADEHDERECTNREDSGPECDPELGIVIPSLHPLVVFFKDDLFSVEAEPAEKGVCVVLLLARVAFVEDEASDHLPPACEQDESEKQAHGNVKKRRRDLVAAELPQKRIERDPAGTRLQEVVGSNADFLGEARDGFARCLACIRPLLEFFRGGVLQCQIGEGVFRLLPELLRGSGERLNLLGFETLQVDCGCRHRLCELLLCRKADRDREKNQSHSEDA